jgi:hypothetical protein
MSIAEKFDRLLKAGDAMAEYSRRGMFVPCAQEWDAARKALGFTGDDLAELVRLATAWVDASEVDNDPRRALLAKFEVPR